MDIQTPLIYRFDSVNGYYAVHPTKMIAVLLPHDSLCPDNKPPKKINFDFFDNTLENDWDWFFFEHYRNSTLVLSAH